MRPRGGQTSMKNFLRLLRYGLPYVLHILPGVLLLAMVGLLDNFRTLLFQPILNNVLDPKAPDGPITLGLPKSQWHFDLRILVPHFMHNAWTVVAFALIASTIVKGLCDYLGTYLVNYCLLYTSIGRFWNWPNALLPPSAGRELSRSTHRSPTAHRGR